MRSWNMQSRGTLVNAAVLLAAGAVVSGCVSKDDIDGFVDRHFSAKAADVVQVDRDFGDIEEERVLRMITTYSSNTYFLYQGMDAGFDYDLLHAFANDNDLILDVVLAGPDDNPLDLLNSGAGDIIAADYPLTPEGRDHARFTRPYNLAKQIMVFSSTLDSIPRTLEEVSGSGLPVTVAANSRALARLEELNTLGYDLNIRTAGAGKDTESLLNEVSDGRAMATVTDDNRFISAGFYLPGLAGGPEIAVTDTVAWAVRKNAPELEERLNSFLYGHFRIINEKPDRSAFLNMLRWRYFGKSPRIASYYNRDTHFADLGLKPAHARMVRAVADTLDVDRLLLMAIIARESSFNPNSKSWAGAVGLMQIMPRFSSIDYRNLYDPEISIREGARILKQHLNHYSYLDSLNQLSFALGTYNVGIGHMVDARRLVMDQNKNPNEWDPVTDALQMLMQPAYYQNARYGYIRGIETVNYVEQIRNRYRLYKRVLELSEHR
ncbi:MAG: transglycosylase SLT domain-containing protein [Balneolales bacterium]